MIVDREPRKRASRDVFLYFDNDAKVRAPVDAKNLIARVANLRRTSRNFADEEHVLKPLSS